MTHGDEESAKAAKGFDKLAEYARARTWENDGPTAAVGELQVTIKSLAAQARRGGTSGPAGRAHPNLLIVAFEVKNTRTDGPASYQGFLTEAFKNADRQPTANGAALLLEPLESDEPAVAGLNRRASPTTLQPGEAVEDVVVFQTAEIPGRPVRLELPAEPFNHLGVVPLTWGASGPATGPEVAGPPGDPDQPPE